MNVEVLKNEPCWCTWKREDRGDHFTKVPYRDKTHRVRVNEPSTWINYETACEIQSNNVDIFSGIGLLFIKLGDYSLCGIDVDAHHDENGNNPYAEVLLQRFHETYIETSPSGSGYHIIFLAETNRVPTDEKGEWPIKYYKKNSNLELEVYVAGFTNRFFTYTGDQVSETNEITDQTDNLLWFLDELMLRPIHQSQGDTVAQVPLENVDIAERLAKARKSRAGAYFISLYDQGDLTGSNNDDSKADIKLVKQLRYWLGPNPALIDEAFRSSALFRDKWDENRGGATYGEITIRNCLERNDGNPIYTPPARNPNGNNQWEAQLGKSEITTDTEVVPDTSTQNVSITPEAVLQLINEAENDKENADRISVLPLMCGTGKSTAIRLKMRQVIEDNDGNGMIVVTDSIDRMRDYLEPKKDEELKQYFKDHADKITVMKHDTIVRDLQRQAECPILIMSTQRFIGMTHSQIEHFLEWDGGRRSLIIVDERPYFKSEIDLDLNAIRQIISAIENGLPDTPEGNEAQEIMLEFWEHSFLFYVREAFNSYKRNYHTKGYHYQYVSFNWREIDRFKRMLKLAEKHRHDLDDFRLSGDMVGIYAAAQASYKILTQGALFTCYVGPRMRKRLSFSVLMDNYAKYDEADAKVIVLDGTADLSTEYMMYDNIDMRIAQCEAYKRDLSQLNIQIVPMSTGKTAIMMNSEGAEELVEKVHTYLESVLPKDRTPVVFSYKDMKDKFSKYYKDYYYNWFGNIKGKNDYREEEFIAQVGMNRFPETSYFLYELDRDPALVNRLIEAPYSEHTGIIANRMKEADGFTKEVRYRELLADLEQNIFRGVIRISSSNKQYHFFLFTSSRDIELIQKIKERYESMNGHVTVATIERSDEDIIEAIMERNADTNSKAIITWHDTELENDTVYTYQDIENGTGVRVRTIRVIRERNRAINELFRKEAEPRRGRVAKFKKNGNWYHRN